MTIAPGISTADELNITLVAADLKPASIIELPPNPSEEVVAQVKNVLTKFGICYRPEVDELILTSTTYDGGNRTPRLVAVTFDIAKNRRSLDRLVDADSLEEKGLALGYPEEAAYNFLTVVGGELVAWDTVHVALAEATKVGIKLPSWLAYISHVPEKLDLINRAVSSSSRVLGEKYQDFIRANNPELAQRVEAQFRNMSLPVTWEKTPDHSYVLQFHS